MSNPNFIPNFSSNEIYRDTDDTRCLTDDLDAIEADIEALESGKANTTHTHTGYAATVHTHSQYADIDHEHNEYATTSHTHAGYATTNHAHADYADIDHTHTGFATATHNHSEYALATDVDALEAKVGDTTVSAQIAAAVVTKADVNHTHTEYAGINHGHSEYATAEHTHDGYALGNHEHTGYAATLHSHSEYAEATHTHDGYASSSHVHSYNDLEDKPTIPTTLPASGGNADTVDGKHASDFALASDVAALQTQVGDTPVAEQISTAVSSKANSVHAHVIGNVTGLQDELDSKYEKPSTGIAKSDLASDVQASLGKADTAIQSLSGYATESYVGTIVADKVDKVDGKGLSSNDYTDAEKSKLSGIEADANKTIVDSALSATSTNPVQNKVVKSAIDALSDLVGDTAVSTQISTATSSTLSSANAYTDTKIADLISSSSTTIETLNEITAAMEENADIVDALEASIGTKANASDLTAHTGNTSNPHGVTKAQIGLGNVENKSSATIRGELTKEDVTDALGYTPPTTNTTYSTVTTSSAGLMSASDKSKLDGIETGANKTVVDSVLSSTSTNPVQNKAVSAAISNLNTLVGDTSVSSQISTAIANKVDKVNGKGLSTNDYTTDEKTKLSGIASGAEVNQNAFTNVVVGSTTISASSKIDTLTFEAGNNITITPDAVNDKITITANDTTYSNATTSVAGLMSNTDKAKLDGIATGATKVTVDSTLSSTSTNPVQNKVVNAAISNLNTLVGDSSVSSQISAAIASKVDAVSGKGLSTNDYTTAEKNKLAGISAGANNYTHPTYTSKSSGLYKVAVDGTGHVSGAIDVTKADITELGIPAQDTTYSVATSSAAGLMPSDDKAYIDSLKHMYIGNLQGKTIADLQTYLKDWIDAVYDVPNATLVIKASDFISLWNNEDTTTTLSNGPSYTFTLKTHFGSTNYALLELCSYYDKKAYYVAFTNGAWGKIRQVAFDVNATTTAAGLMSAADKVKLNSIEEGAQNNVFSSLTDIGITTFPTTMSAVASAMPANSMIVIDTRRVNGSGTDYDTEEISDWNNATNGMALIMKGATTARVTMLILYGSSESDHGDFTVGNYAVTNNTVSWSSSDDFLDTKVDKIIKKAAVDLNTLTESGLYYVSDETTALHCPAGSNGHMLVMSDGTRVRQVFFRVGTVDTNSFQWYSRHLGSDLTVGDNGWSQWWLLSGSELAWSGTAKLNAEINLGSRYGCQAWVIAGQPTKTDTYSTIYIPRQFLTTNTTKWKLQIADETGYVSFYFYYKASDDNVYAKVVWVSDTTNSALRYAYRVS